MIAFSFVLAALAPAARPEPRVADDVRVADLYEEGAEEHWQLEAGGKTIGDHWWRYVGEEELAGAPAWRFSAGARLVQTTVVGEVELRSTSELWTDAHGHPRRCLFRMQATGVLTSIEMTIADGSAHAHLIQGPSARDLDFAVPPDAYLLSNNYIGELELVAALAPPTAGAPSKAQLVSPDVFKVVPFELRDQGTIKSKVDGKDVELRKFRDSLGEALQVLPDGKLWKIEIPPQGVVIRRVDTPAEKFTLEAPAIAPTGFASEEVEIARDAVKIAGTVTKREGATGRLPAVFFVSGSGLQDRQGMSAGVDLGTHEILDRLTNEGFLVLRVDDRGAGKSTGPLTDLTYDDLVADARSCVDFLLARADVDPGRVVVIGHSEGGETAPILAAERPLAAIVLMAGPGRGMIPILRDQKRLGLEEAGAARAMLESELEVHAKFLELVTGDAPIDESQVRADYRPFLSQRAWFRSHAKQDPIANVKRVKCPVLVLQGGKDFQVSPERDAKALDAALEEARHPDHALRVFPDLDHLFKRCPGAKSTLADYATARPVDPEFLDALVAWLKQRLMR